MQECARSILEMVSNVSLCRMTVQNNSTLMVSGSSDRMVCIWGMLTGRMVGQLLEGHERSVWCVVFSPDGKCVVSGSEDSTIQVWSTETRRLDQILGCRTGWNVTKLVFLTRSSKGQCNYACSVTSPFQSRMTLMVCPLLFVNPTQRVQQPNGFPSICPLSLEAELCQI